MVRKNNITLAEDPIPGFYKTKLNGKGAEVPARIYIVPGDRDEFGELESDDIWHCEIDGEPSDPWEQWSYLMGAPISEAEFDYMTARNKWDRENDPDSPFANPKKPMDISKTKSLF